MSEYKIIDATQISREKWWDFTDNNENCNIFSTPYMYDVWNETPGYKSFTFFAIDRNEEIKGILSGYLQTVSPGVLSKISTRAVLMQSPVALDDEALSTLLKHYISFMKRKAVYTEIRNNYNTSKQRHIYEEAGFHYEDHLNIIVDLSQSENILWEQIHSSRRKNIKKAIKNGVFVSKLTNDYLVESYSIMKEVYNRIKLPLPSILFFENALLKSTENMGMIIYGVFLTDNLIGVRFTLQYKDTVFGLFAGSISQYYDKHPNDIFPWEVFKLCKKEGKTVFDFGGAGKPNVPYGVRDYKMSFGGKLVNYGRYTLVHHPLKMKLAETGFKSLQKNKGIKTILQSKNKNYNY
jgi:lipid II:glycine glycyltransferase (peptidoglycan interpeptide bridge formation enzyme)